MSNSGNKGVFSNNIGSSVGAFTKRNSSDAGNAGSSGGSTTERRRVRLALNLLGSTLLSQLPHHSLSLLTLPTASPFSISTLAMRSMLLHFSSLE